MSHETPMRRKPLVAVAVAVPLVIALAIPLARRSFRTETDTPPLAKLSGAAAAAAAIAPPPPTLVGLDLTKIEVKDHVVAAPLPDKKSARLAIDPALQRVADNVMSAHHLPEAVVVMMDVETGRILVYASHIEKGPKRDLAVEATAPAASVFKIVTGTSLVENAGATPDQKECYSGGEQRINAQDLVPDPKRDRWCTTLGGAMGRSINTVFARLALANLKPAQLDETARSLGFNASLPFDVPVQPSGARFPDDQLGFARTAAGFWNTSLSPLHAAWLGATIARGGEPVRPVLVTDIVEDGKVVWSAPSGLAQKRVMKSDTAHAITSMMDMTVSDGTSYRAFHDSKGRAFLPGISVASKTGTLTDATNQRYYTWFAGFAPSKPVAFPPVGDRDARSVETQKDGHEPTQPRKVAFGVLVVNDPKWTIKANVLAREVLRAHFAAQHVPGVTAPRSAAEHDRDQPRDGGPPTMSTAPATKQRLHRGS
jgi:penicillin-binding protein A